MKSLFYFLTIAFAFLISNYADAATYYVATTGLDSNSCSVAMNLNTPKRNLTGTNGGISCLLFPGDALLVRGGVYDETVSNTSLYTNASPSWPSGTSWINAIRVAAYPGEEVTLKGFNFGDCCANPVLPKLSYWIFDGFQLTQSIYLAHNADHLRFINNEINGSSPDGGLVHIVDGASADEIINNKVHDAPSDCVPGHRYYSVYLSEASDILIGGNEFYNMPGGGIHMYNAGGPKSNGTIIRNNSIHDNNWCTTSGVGGILVSDADNTSIYNNRIYKNGVFDGTYGWGPGIGFSHNTTNTKIYNNTVYANQSWGIGAGGTSNLGTVIRNNISWNNRYASIYVDSVNNMIQDHNLCNSGCAVNADPQFVNLSTNDFHLQSASPAINQGTTLSEVTADFDGVFRPQGTAYDIGAYEYVSGTTTLPGDLNGDRIVNSLDWSLMSAKWLTNDALADLNKDGAVNSLDWSIMSGNWLKTI